MRAMFPVFFTFSLFIGLTSCNHEPKKLTYDQEITQSLNQYLEVSSIIFALSKISNKKIINEQCFDELKAIEVGILRKEPWAMKVRDSSGEKESGFIWGHNYWLGSKQGCEAAQDPLQITLSDQFLRIMKKGLINQIAPFKMDYRVVYLKQNSPWQIEIELMPKRILHIGLCLPLACSSSEIKNLTQYLLDSNILEENEILELRAEVMYVKDLKLKDSFFEQKSFKISIACVIFTLIMTITAGCLKSNTKHLESRLFLLIKCFDGAKNAQELFTLNGTSSNSIPVINGLKCLCCFWVVMCHVMLYMYFTVNNKTFLLTYAEQPLFQYVTISPLIVDLLFSISGFLLAYNFIKNEKLLNEIRRSTLRQNVTSFGKMVVYRYLRLAPLYLVIATMVALFTSYVNDVSVFHISNRYDQVCSKYWWKNFLLIQNLFDHNELCLNWSWSLACEMQYYYLVLGLLFVYSKYPKIVKNLVLIALIASIVWSYILAIKHLYQFSFDMIMQSGNELYINPFIRIPPYLVGSIGGYYLAKHKGDLKIDSAMEKNIWNVTALVLIACVYSNFKRDLSAFHSITLLMGSRLLIAMVVCWMIIASATGRGCSWSRILEWKIFRHIHRLSYAIYLLNPFIITIVFSLSKSSSYADPLQLCVVACGFGVITYLASIIFSLAFEIPYCNLSSMLLKKNIKTT